VLVEKGRDALLHEAVAAGADGTRASVHLLHNCPGDDARPLSVSALAALTTMEVAGQLTATQAKTIVVELLEADGEGDPVAIAKANGFEAMDTRALEAAVDAAIAAQPEAWAKYLAGDPKVAGSFVGAVMKATKGQADGKAVTALLEARKNA
jgi:aspartyl-tRNA(Asn)/glutamyl-tRNA(Gln) amidotransferase subunit B